MTIDDFVKILTESSQHKYLYHFTDRSNLESIKKFGIKSKTALQGLNITPTAPGGNDWSREADATKGLLNYVNLCFTRDHPMCYSAKEDGRLVDPIYVAISPDVLKIAGAKVTVDVANQSGLVLHDVANGLLMLDADVIYNRRDWKDAAVKKRLNAARRYELLIPVEVPLNLITKIF
jgi:hypothetical protein